MSAEMSRGVPKELNLLLERYAVSFLSQGRKDWDEPHTKAVVHYATEIALAEDLDVLVLVSAAWLHDIGYYGLFKDSNSKILGSVMDKKSMHMINGARLAKEFLELDVVKHFFKPSQVEEIIHLVSVHDKVEELDSKNEIALMEADTLGAIDIERVATTFNMVDSKKYVEKELFGRRFPKFRTYAGKNYFQELFPKFVREII